MRTVRGAGEAPLRVLVRAPYPALRAGLAELLRVAGLAVVDDARDDGAPLLDADVLVVDAGDDEPGAVEEARLLGLPTVFLRDSRRPPRLDAPPGAPAEGWIARDATAEELAAAVRAVAAGLTVLDAAAARAAAAPVEREASATPPNGAHLTAREVEVLGLIAVGLGNKAIAQRLGISEHTVKFHVGAVLSKLDARSRTEAVTVAARSGLLAL